jgi:3-deoxy-manno-octulosonate cytidylyltransferase (CMP-KDO synthetase)
VATGERPQVRAAIIIPARLASTRLAEKLLLAETGKAVLAHTVERALAARDSSGGLIDEVVCAVDDEALARAARSAGAKAVMTPRECRSGTDRIAIVARGMSCDVVVNLQGDEPEADPAAIVAVARLLEDPREPAVMGTLACPVRSEPEARNDSVVKVVLDSKGYALYFSRLAIPYVRAGGVEATRLRHLGIYSYRRRFLLEYGALPPSPLEEAEKLEQLRALAAGYRIRVGLVESAAPGIDTLADYQGFVERYRSRRKSRRGG